MRNEPFLLEMECNERLRGITRNTSNRGGSRALYHRR